MAPTTSNSTSASVVEPSKTEEIKSRTLVFEMTSDPATASTINTGMEFRTGPGYIPFTLDKSFVADFEKQTPPFGFNGLGELVYMRTYSRIKADDTKERWFETVERVINGTFNMQKKWLQQLGQPWDEEEMTPIAQEMYTRVFQMKFTPPGRGLWAMGSPITEDRGLYAALNNCAFVSTADILELDTPAEPFCFLMEAAMLGVGVGFDTKGAGHVVVRGCDEAKTNTFVIPDSREGWVESVKMLLEAHFLHQPTLKFDYSLIRAAGEPIKGFGGISSGAGSLTALHEAIESILKPLAGKPLTARGIVDIMNQMGVCVVSGNVRRTAEIAFGDYNDEEYVDLKNYEKNPDRAAFGWTSNNSIFADIGMDYKPIADRIVRNGEPGFAWLENMRNYGRMNGIKDDRDRNASGGNPCLEQTLESYEMCCLVETFPCNHESLEDFLETLKYAYKYAKTVTLGQTQWPQGCSATVVLAAACRVSRNSSRTADSTSSSAGARQVTTRSKKLTNRFRLASPFLGPLRPPLLSPAGLCHCLQAPRPACTTPRAASTSAACVWTSTQTFYRHFSVLATRLSRPMRLRTPRWLSPSQWMSARVCVRCQMCLHGSSSLSQPSCSATGQTTR